MRVAVVVSGAPRQMSPGTGALCHAPLFACVKQANKTVELVDETQLNLSVCLSVCLPAWLGDGLRTLEERVAHGGGFLVGENGREC